MSKKTVVGITGGPCAGKATFARALRAELARRGRNAVISNPCAEEPERVLEAIQAAESDIVLLVFDYEFRKFSAMSKLTVWIDSELDTGLAREVRRSRGDPLNMTLMLWEEAARNYRDNLHRHKNEATIIAQNLRADRERLWARIPAGIICDRIA